MEISIKNIKDPLISDEEVVKFLEQSWIKIKLDNNKWSSRITVFGKQIERTELVFLYKQLLAWVPAGVINLQNRTMSELEWTLNNRYREHPWRNIPEIAFGERRWKEINQDTIDKWQKVNKKIWKLRAAFIDIRLKEDWRILFCGKEIKEDDVNNIYNAVQNGKTTRSLHILGQRVSRDNSVEIPYTKLISLEEKEVIENMKKLWVRIDIIDGDITFCNVIISIEIVRKIQNDLSTNAPHQINEKWIKAYESGRN